MSYANPISLSIVQEVVDDLEDNNAHAICDLLRTYYGLLGRVPDAVFSDAYEAASNVFQDYRMKKFAVINDAG